MSGTVVVLLSPAKAPIIPPSDLEAHITEMGHGAICLEFVVNGVRSFRTQFNTEYALALAEQLTAATL